MPTQNKQDSGQSLGIKTTENRKPYIIIILHLTYEQEERRADAPGAAGIPPH